MHSVILRIAKCYSSLLLIPFFAISIKTQIAVADPSGYTAPPPPHRLNYLCTTSESERFSGTSPITDCGNGYIMLSEACTPTSFVTTAHLGSFASIGSIGLIAMLSPLSNVGIQIGVAALTHSSLNNAFAGLLVLPLNVGVGQVFSISGPSPTNQQIIVTCNFAFAS